MRPAIARPIHEVLALEAATRAAMGNYRGAGEILDTAHSYIDFERQQIGVAAWSETKWNYAVWCVRCFGAAMRADVDALQREAA